MCGIVGFFGKGLDRNKSFVNDMLNLIRHRGPDNKKFFFTNEFHGGFCRLSIIDLTRSADQPFYINKNDNLVLFFNGEIYNYKELKKELEISGYDFKTSSDTEVLYNCILHFGIERFTSHLIGMFAIVCYRPITKELFLIRDQLGIKPLYFTEIGSYIFFSSEIKAFKYLKLKLNKNKIIEYLSLGTNIGADTIYKNTFSVLPGQSIKISLNLKKEKISYFKLIDTFQKSKTFNHHELFDLLVKTIKMHTRSDVKYGCQFSGGLDSSLIASFVSRLESEKIKGFSVLVNHGLLNENKYQKSLSQKIGLERTEIIFGIEEFVNKSLLENYNYDFDFPLKFNSKLLPNSAYYIFT